MKYEMKSNLYKIEVTIFAKYNEQNSRSPSSSTSNSSALSISKTSAMLEFQCFNNVYITLIFKISRLLYTIRSTRQTLDDHKQPQTI